MEVDYTEEFKTLPSLTAEVMPEPSIKTETGDFVTPEQFKLIQERKQYEKLFKYSRPFRKAVLNKRFSRTAIRPSL